MNLCTFLIICKTNSSPSDCFQKNNTNTDIQHILYRVFRQIIQSIVYFPFSSVAYIFSSSLDMEEILLNFLNFIRDIRLKILYSEYGKLLEALTMLSTQ